MRNTSIDHRNEFYLRLVLSVQNVGSNVDDLDHSHYLAVTQETLQLQLNVVIVMVVQKSMTLVVQAQRKYDRLQLRAIELEHFKQAHFCLDFVHIQLVLFLLIID